MLTEKQWTDLFEKISLDLIETVSDEDAEYASNPDSGTGMAFTTARANELIAMYPDKKDTFDSYVRSQKKEWCLKTDNHHGDL